MPASQAHAASVGKAKITSITAKYVGKATVKAGKVKGASGYEFRIGTNKAVTKNVTKKSASKPKAIFKKLKVKKTYFVKVRAYVKKNGKKVYGKWSKVRSLKFVIDKDYHDYCIAQGDYYKGQYKLAQAKLVQAKTSGPGIYDPFAARNDPTYRSRYSREASDYRARVSAAEADRDYYEGLMNDWYAEADTQYAFIGYPR
jgi:hypothetical protein